MVDRRSGKLDEPSVASFGHDEEGIAPHRAAGIGACAGNERNKADCRCAVCSSWQRNFRVRALTIRKRLDHERLLTRWEVPVGLGVTRCA